MNRCTQVLGSGLAVVVGLCGCPSASHDGDQPAEARAVPVGDGPTIDCDAWSKKVDECFDTLAPLYAKTETGSAAGKGLDGTVDYAAAEERFGLLWKIESIKLCSGPSELTTPYAQRDPRWRVRFAECDVEAPCDAWSTCMATAMGQPLQ